MVIVSQNPDEAKHSGWRYLSLDLFVVHIFVWLTHTQKKTIHDDRKAIIRSSIKLGEVNTFVEDYNNFFFLFLIYSYKQNVDGVLI